MDEIYTLVANVGFPIAMAGYLLIRMETKMDKLTEAVTSLSMRLK